MTTEELLVLKQRLAEAELAEHKIATGTQLVTLSYSAEGSHMHQFKPADLPQLKAYISELKSKIAAAEGTGNIRKVFYIT